jgi:hypothetical protein
MTDTGSQNMNIAYIGRLIRQELIKHQSSSQSLSSPLTFSKKFIDEQSINYMQSGASHRDSNIFNWSFAKLHN